MSLSQYEPRHRGVAKPLEINIFDNTEYVLPATYKGKRVLHETQPPTITTHERVLQRIVQRAFHSSLVPREP